LENNVKIPQPINWGIALKNDKLLTLVCALLVPIIGAVSWLNTTHNLVVHAKEQISKIDINISKQDDKISNQDERLSRIEGKLDIMLRMMKRRRMRKD
jgi:hypothetical protein